VIDTLSTAQLASPFFKSERLPAMQRGRETMFGCDRCGAQVRRDDSSCPICGALVTRPAGIDIPVRRFGEVPPYPVEYEQMLEEDGPGLERRREQPRLAQYALATISALLLAACGYWLR
jgi:hypothetical protein